MAMMGASSSTVTNGIKSDQAPVMRPPEESRKKLLGCFLGIFISYFIFGILQENITRGRYGENDERFHYTVALVFVQCVVNACFARVALQIQKPGPDSTPQTWYAVMTFSYVGAMLASNHALQYVPYPTQVLGKSVKPIPIMILGVLFARKRYPVAKYFCVMLIVLGVMLFVFKDKKGAADSTGAFGWGETLLVISLLMDGMTGAIQDRIRAEHTAQTYSMMLNMNTWSTLYLGILLVLTGEGVEFAAFFTRYPSVLLQMVLFSMCSAIGQNFIFLTVTNFGPLMCSIITTTRKFFTILASVIIFANPMSGRQWFGTVLVFAGLGLDSVYGKTPKHGKHDKK